MNKNLNSNASSVEWYNPGHIIKFVHDFYGEIDLDPTSCHFANKTVKAKQFFTKEQNGFARRWFGRVWLTLPYSRKMLPQFIAAIIEKRDEYKELLVLVNRCTEAELFNNLIGIGSMMICLIKKRVRFKNKKVELVNFPKQGQVIVYVGPDKLRFRKIFSKLGQVIEIQHERREPAA